MKNGSRRISRLCLFKVHLGRHKSTKSVEPNLIQGVTGVHQLLTTKREIQYK